MNTYIELASIKCYYYPADYEFDKDGSKRTDAIDDEEMTYPGWEDTVEELPNGNLRTPLAMYYFRVEPFGQQDGELTLEMERQAMGNDVYIKHLKMWVATIKELFNPEDRSELERDFDYGEFVGVFQINYKTLWTDYGEEYDSEIKYLGRLDMTKLEWVK